MPICNIVTQQISKMSDDCFRWSRKGIDLINDGQKPTSTALSVHSSVLLRCYTLLCTLEGVAVDGSFTCVVHKSPDEAADRVRVTPSYTLESPYLHYQEMEWPCDHVVATIRAVSTLVGLPQYQNVRTTGGLTRSGTSTCNERRTQGS